MNYIYKISNDINNHLYIGKTGRTIQDRFNEHLRNSKKEYKNRPLYDAMNKYGVEHFYIEKIDECETDKEASEKEIYWISYYNTYKKGYNATLGGDGTAYLNLNEEEVIEKYKELKSKRSVGRYFNVDEKTIRNILKKHNVKTIPRKQQKIVMIKDQKIIKIFNEVKNANKYLGINEKSTNIYHVLNNNRKTAYGYEWKYLYQLGSEII